MCTWNGQVPKKPPNRTNYLGRHSDARFDELRHQNPADDPKEGFGLVPVVYELGDCIQCTREISKTFALVQENVLSVVHKMFAVVIPFNGITNSLRKQFTDEKDKAVVESIYWQAHVEELNQRSQAPEAKE